MNYFKITINRTAKGFEKDDNWQSFDKEEKLFKTLEQVKTFLSNEYSGHKKVKIFVDDKDGKARQVGWIYCFKNKDISHDSGWWFQQDWITISEVNEKEVLI
ncbi:MAG: hypothetical protein Athens071426_416 [Parcubacteria group bacterium Athens0714_26]|nr:MAG: hypothetical protein Athens071426_416 [Parcubacteria group bacterium Athens0714_26]